MAETVQRIVDYSDKMREAIITQVWQNNWQVWNVNKSGVKTRVSDNPPHPWQNPIRYISI